MADFVDPGTPCTTLCIPPEICDRVVGVCHKPLINSTPAVALTTTTIDPLTTSEGFTATPEHGCQSAQKAVQYERIMSKLVPPRSCSLAL
ncbi:hypothetical protein DdX_21976 [Ditylenchus destructor]|uniref:Uncharacterized protein n=1 Tax=Ditylenchus destructor TaxID=166010 RepID=A0AAD4MIS2_9BILA|nr:hypothetical protein DdX_21976 [Ditylenchus destructor]